jgi:hypothetical protein
MRYSAVVNYAGAVEIPLLPRHPTSSSSSASTSASQPTPATFTGGFSASRAQQHPQAWGPHTYVQRPFAPPGAGTFSRPYFQIIHTIIVRLWLYYILIIQGDRRLFRQPGLNSRSRRRFIRLEVPDRRRFNFRRQIFLRRPLRLCSSLLSTRPSRTSWPGMSLGTATFSRPWMAPHSRPTRLARHSWHSHHWFWLSRHSWQTAERPRPTERHRRAAERHRMLQARRKRPWRHRLFVSRLARTAGGQGTWPLDVRPGPHLGWR